MGREEDLEEQLIVVVAGGANSLINRRVEAEGSKWALVAEGGDSQFSKEARALDNPYKVSHSNLLHLINKLHQDPTRRKIAGTAITVKTKHANSVTLAIGMVSSRVKAYLYPQ